jgi:hypothetical protein
MDQVKALCTAKKIVPPSANMKRVGFQYSRYERQAGEFPEHHRRRNNRVVLPSVDMEELFRSAPIHCQTTECLPRHWMCRAAPATQILTEWLGETARLTHKGDLVHTGSASSARLTSLVSFEQRSLRLLLR